MSITGQTQERLAEALCDHDAANQIITAINLGAASPVFTSGVDASHLGFFGTALSVQAAAYTQTYSAAARTNPAMTASAVATTAATASSPYGYGQAQADSLVAAVNALIVDVTALKGLVNSLIDDGQAYGLIP